MWSDYSYAYKKTILIGKDKVVSDCIGFPVLVSITDAMLRNIDNGGHVQSNRGYDICFYDQTDKILLPHEIESYDGVNGTIVYWVKANLSSAVNTLIYMYYGKPKVTINPSSTDVWDTDYMMVQHMNDATTMTTADSTLNSNNGAKTAANEPIQTDGKIRYGQLFDATNDKINCSNNPGLTPTTSLTVSAWIYPHVVNSWQQASVLDKQEPSKYQYKLGLNDIGNVRFDFWKDQATCYSPAGGTVTPDNWQFICGRTDGTNAKVFLNSLLVGSVACSDSCQNVDSRLYVGYEPANNRWFDGIIDEVRVSRIARSDGWIQTEYNNQKSPIDFMTVFPEVSVYQAKGVEIEACNTSFDICMGSDSFTVELPGRKIKIP